MDIAAEIKRLNDEADKLDKQVADLSFKSKTARARARSLTKMLNRHEKEVKEVLENDSQPIETKK